MGRRVIKERWLVCKHFYEDDHETSDEWPVLYGTEAEALEMKSKLEAGCDKSFYDVDNVYAGAILFVQKINL